MGTMGTPENVKGRDGSRLQPFVAGLGAAKVPLWSIFGAVKVLLLSSSAAAKVEFCSNRSKFWSWSPMKKGLISTHDFPNTKTSTTKKYLPGMPHNHFQKYP